MESVEEAIALLRLKIAETEKIKKRQETELAELIQVLEDIKRHTKDQKKVAKEQKRRLLLAKVQKEERDKIRLRREKRLGELRQEFLQNEEDEARVLPS
jgi:hypothetical protein